MLHQSLQLTTPPATEPVTLAELKAWSRLDTDDEDATLTSLISAARQSAEEYTRRSFVTQAWKLTLDLCAQNQQWWDGVVQGPVGLLYGSLPKTIPLPKGPVQSITSVVTYDLDNTASTYPTGSYRVDTSGDRLHLNYGSIWPSNLRREGACEITYIAGYGAAAAVPNPIKQAILILASTLYEQRGQCDDPNSLPPMVQSLLGRYRVLGDRLG